MILTDQNIRERIHSDNLIENYASDHIQNICYDLTAEHFYAIVDGEPEESSTYELLPGQSLHVSAKENIHLSNRMIARIIGKNSRIREGLFVDAPVYQPGHHTKVFFRLTNISSSSIKLFQGQSYCAIMFEELAEEPEHPYNGAFQNEFDYAHLASYETQYSRELNHIEEEIDKFKQLEHTVYGNVLTIMTIFIAIFSIINVNVSLADGANTVSFLTFNLVTLGSVSFLGNLILCYFNKKSFNHKLWFIPVLCFILSVISYIYL